MNRCSLVAAERSPGDIYWEFLWGIINDEVLLIFSAVLAAFCLDNHQILIVKR